jgi:hypothetical protein
MNTSAQGDGQNHGPSDTPALGAASAAGGHAPSMDAGGVE